MMRVEQEPEPATFDARVRTPGLAYLASLAPGTEPDFENRDYWKRCKDDLRLAYSAICAYTSFFVSPVTGSESVEHFQPKKLFPAVAYEWSNYRFVCGRLNGRKGKRTNLVDPFEIPDDLFLLGVPSMLLVVNASASNALRLRAEDTIRDLGLNDELCVPHRLKWLQEYAEGEITLTYLSGKAPFLAREIRRQKLTRKRLKEILSP